MNKFFIYLTPLIPFHKGDGWESITPFINQVEDNISSGRFVSSKKIRVLVSTYLKKECARTDLQKVDRHLGNWFLVPDQVLIDNLRTFLRSKANPSGREGWHFAMPALVIPRLMHT